MSWERNRRSIIKNLEPDWEFYSHPHTQVASQSISKYPYPCYDGCKISPAPTWNIFGSIIKCQYFPVAQTLACGIKTYIPGGMIDFQNIETGSPFMSGTLRNKLFVGRHSRWRKCGNVAQRCRLHHYHTRTRSAKDCQGSCARDRMCTSWTWSTKTHRYLFFYV